MPAGREIQWSSKCLAQYSPVCCSDAANVFGFYVNARYEFFLITFIYVKSLHSTEKKENYYTEFLYNKKNWLRDQEGTNKWL